MLEIGPSSIHRLRYLRSHAALTTKSFRTASNHFPIRTLLPSRLSPSDLLHPSGHARLKIDTPVSHLDRDGTGTGTGTGILPYQWSANAKRYAPWPKDEKGFLYYRRGPAHALIAGELRFRVVSSGRPEDFQSGSDLMVQVGSDRRVRPRAHVDTDLGSNAGVGIGPLYEQLAGDFSSSGGDRISFAGDELIIPWRVPLAAMATVKHRFQAFLNMLVDPNADAILKVSDLTYIRAAIASKACPQPSLTSTIIHFLGQPFTFDLSQSRRSVYCARGLELKIARLKLQSVPRFEGHMLCSFERYKDTFALRIHKLPASVPSTPGSSARKGHAALLKKGELVKTHSGQVCTVNSSVLEAIETLHDPAVDSSFNREKCL